MGMIASPQLFYKIIIINNMEKQLLTLTKNKKPNRLAPVGFTVFLIHALVDCSFHNVSPG
jgi:hypothetical protein